MKPRICVLLLLLLISLIIVPIHAQEDDHPVLEMLAFVPLNVETLDTLVSYVDYRAVEQARPGAAQPASHAEWKALNDARDESLGLWMAASFGISSGSGEIIQAGVRFGDEWQDLLGMDFFDIDRELYFGDPPADVVVLQGEFDAQSIIEAFTARDFTADSLSDFTLLCGNEDCDGLQMDFNNTNPANPFGGRLGRPEPLLISDTFIINANGGEALELIYGIQTGEASSLATHPNYLATVNALPKDGLLQPDTGILRQAYWIPATEFLFDPAALLGASSTPEQARAALAELSEGFDSIPQFQLVMIADTAADTKQIVIVALVYDTEADAQIAADIIPTRLDNTESLAMRVPFNELLKSRNVESVDGRVQVDEETGKALALITFRAPLATNEEGDVGFMSSSLVYRLFIDMIFRRDYLWLLPSLPEME